MVAQAHFEQVLVWYKYQQNLGHMISLSQPLGYLRDYGWMEDAAPDLVNV